MLFSLDEHELRTEGLQHKPLEFGQELTETAISVSVIDYERSVRESCEYDPVFNDRIEDLQSYSLDELESALSLSSSDLFSARNDLERFVAVNVDMNGKIPPEMQQHFVECREKLSAAVVRHEMLLTAIKLKQQNNSEAADI